MTVRIALAGNPNSGKTTVFNRLTGARQHVGNYPGVTVEKKEGVREHRGYRIEIVDLPGTYSLTAHSIEELIARNFVIEEKPDVVVDIVDATNLERNLYLAVQFIELGVPLVLAMNMSDLARAHGCEIDHERLSVLLGAAVVPTVATKGEGMNQLLDTVIRVGSGEHGLSPVTVRYGREIEDEIGRLSGLLEECPELGNHYGLRWLAVKLLENDNEVRGKIQRECHQAEKIFSTVEESSRHLEGVLGDVPEIIIADRRYGFISGACRESVRTTVQTRYDMSERIDSILANRIIGLPLFFGLMYLVFQVTFALGDPLMGLLERFFSWLGQMVSMLWPRASESALRSLLVDGVIGGVGSVISFLPNILFLFLAIAVLEDSGYMARAAFIMDRVMHKVGLHGKSFIPMLIGFGCSVPAIMATRTLENRTDRLTTILVIPLISCGARLTIYLLIIPAFFPLAWRARVLWIMYLTGILLAMLSARLIRSTLLRGEATPFVMELPPYRMPTVRGVVIHMWERGWLFLKKAGTIILGLSIVLWALTSYPRKSTFDVDYEGMLAEARGEYLRGVTALNPLLGLPDDSEALVSTMKAELQMAEEEEKYYTHQEGFREARGREDAVIEKRKGTEEEPIVLKFLRVRKEARKPREEFERAVREGKVKKDTPGYALLVKKRDAGLDRARRIAPTVYPAVMRYLEAVEAPFEEKTERVHREKHAEELAYSTIGRIGHGLEPVLKPLGFDWRIGTALVGAFAAKEVFVAQMGIMFSVGEAERDPDNLRRSLSKNYTPLTAFCIMLFSLVSMPCMATVAVTRREAGSWKWAALQVGGLTVLAYVLTLLVYQVGSLLI